MPKPRVYVETTIPSCYYDVRQSPAVAERRRATRRWWAGAVARYQLVTGAPVLAELAAGISSRARLRMALLDGLPVLVPDPAVVGIVQTYVHPLVSGYKSKSCNWLHVDSSDIRNFAGENACESSIFSKRLTLRICNIV